MRRDRLVSLRKTHKICLFLILATHCKWNPIFFPFLLQGTGKFTVVTQKTNTFTVQNKTFFFKYIFFILNNKKILFLTKELTVVGKIYFHLTPFSLLKTVQIESFLQQPVQFIWQFLGFPVLSFRYCHKEDFIQKLQSSGYSRYPSNLLEIITWNIAKVKL